MNPSPGSRWPAWGLLAACAIVLAGLFGERGAPGSLLPHGYCFTWNAPLLWTHVVSDTLIGLAYLTIPVTLLHLVRKRADMPFNWIVVLFAVFIVSCGMTHWIEVWTVWHPDYWLAASAKVVTAAASLLTAAALVHLVPLILALPTGAQLRAAKTALEVEVEERRRIEDELRRERAELEDRVLKRTRELAQATAAAESAHAEAEQANRLKDTFLAKVSHELRTPLQSTLSWAGVLRQSTADPVRSAQACERIIHNVHAQARLIDDLLDISRILSGQLRLDLQPADIVAVVERAVEVVCASARNRHVEIELSVPTERAPVLTDATRLEQVVWNLLSNAVQSTADGGRVVVSVAVESGHLRIDVRDWGRGIAAADLPHIFEAFRQGSGSENRHRGLGLGLAITHHIVELFGGWMQAQSDGAGYGACFSVWLPMQQAAVDAATQSQPGLTAAEQAQLHGLRVLFVEDEPDIAEGGRNLLTALGADVEVCLGFEQARQRLVEGGFDILLSDLDLGGGKSGTQLLAILRSQPHGRAMPAVVLSAYGSQEDRQASRAAGFAQHVVKPAQAEEVARALVAALPAAG